jgi:flagellar basal-body rod modification protein FlgD
MTEVTPVTTPVTAPPPPTSQQPRSSGAISADFNTFLRMLTTQMKNQDPLNPMDNSEFAVQLATFSGVEQQVRTNSLLESLATQMGVSGLTQYAGWVGKEGRADMPVWFDGAPVSLSATLNAQADRAELVVKDSAGAVVTRQEVPDGQATFTWEGTDANGAPLPDGRYTFALESFAGPARISSTPVEAYARITEVRGGATPALVFAGGVEVAASEVTALRDG